MFLRNLLNVLVQIENKMGLQKKTWSDNMPGPTGNIPSSQAVSRSIEKAEYLPNIAGFGKIRTKYYTIFFILGFTFLHEYHKENII
jgi:hypothetical protein